ncbi:MAG: hypothetical protein AB7T38_11140 [Nitrospirales bacterium]
MPIFHIFQSWKHAHIDFVVLRNYANLPADPGNDLDILIGQQQVHQAETILIGTMQCLGFRMYNRAEFACLSLYFINEANQPLHIDLFTEFTWRGFCFFPSANVLNDKTPAGIFTIPHPIHEALLNLLTRLLYHGYVHEKYKPFIYQTFQTHPALALKWLDQIFGHSLATHLIKAVLEKDWKYIENQTWALRLQLIKREILRHPLLTTQNLFQFSLRIIRRFFHPPGLLIILLGPDGSGKSTLAHRLIEDLGSRLFVGPGSYFHWKATKFLKSQNPQPDICPNPHEAGPRNPFVSLVFFLYHWMEFAIGSLIRLRPLLCSNRMIIFDRYYHDFEVDQTRYRLNVPQTVINLGKYFLRQPDLIFGLTTSPDILQSRKNEVSREEAIRQGDAYAKLVNTHKNGYVIDASESPEEIEKKVRFLILEFLVKRTNASLSISISTT